MYINYVKTENIILYILLQTQSKNNKKLFGLNILQLRLRMILIFPYITVKPYIFAAV